MSSKNPEYWRFIHVNDLIGSVWREIQMAFHRYSLPSCDLLVKFKQGQVIDFCNGSAPLGFFKDSVKSYGV